MKTGWMFLLFALASAACGADQPNPGPAATADRPASTAAALDSGAELQIAFDETVSFHDLELRLLEVNDSRCPSGVTCVWAGEARVTLQVSRVKSDGKETVKLQLVLNGRNKPAAASAFGYVLELLDLDPYPKSGVTPERGHYLAYVGVSEAATVRSKLSRDQ